MTLRVQGLCKAFGQTRLFAQLSFALHGPMVLSAPSGWGKTTLLRILMGLEKADAGSIQGVGRVAAVFQEDRLCPQLTAEQNVRLVLPAAPRQAQAAQSQSVCAGLAALGLDEAARALPASRLSGGQKRRVALLRALLAPADTLLLDEPFTGLDREAMLAAVALLQQNAQGRNVLLATHDEAAIRALGWPVLRPAGHAGA